MLPTQRRQRHRHPTPVLLPGESHGQRSLVGCSPWGCRVRHNWATSLSLFTFTHWRRKCNPLQYSCLENPRDGGAWWAAVCEVAQSRTWLKRLSSRSSILPTSSAVKNLPANAGDAGSVPESGRSPGGGNGNPLQYSCLGNLKDRRAWWAIVHGGVTKDQTWLSNYSIGI